MEIIEEINQGYCRGSDQSRIVTCEYHMEDGKKVLEYIDCAYGACIHSKTCKLVQCFDLDSTPECENR